VAHGYIVLNNDLGFSAMKHNTVSGRSKTLAEALHMPGGSGG